MMPFRFERLASGQVIVTNQSGEFAFLRRDEFDELVSGTLSRNSPEYLGLKAKHFITDGPDTTTLRVAASQWRTKKAFLEGGPKLHIFVPTLRCNQSCGYCQVSRAAPGTPGVDMDRRTASLAIDIMMASPSPAVTMEFQGGEPLLAFELLRWMIETATARSTSAGKEISFVVCTNLTLLSDQHIAFLKEHNVAISTSLDGPADIHDRNRPLTGAAAHSLVVDNIRRCQDALGRGSVSALMTTTARSLGRGCEIVDEYVRLGLHSVFLREINPYGYASKSLKALGYDVEAFVSFYADTLRYIIDLNHHGVHFSEGYTGLLLRKILTPFGIGFVDLQSPTGQGFGVVVYNHDGNVYASDEGRMLAEMGDPAFRLGSVEDSWKSLFFGETMQILAAAGVAEALPGCSDCAYVVYCGADPIRRYRMQGDPVGHRPTDGFCKKHKAIFEIIMGLLADGSLTTHEILLGWLNPGRTSLPRPEWL